MTKTTALFAALLALCGTVALADVIRQAEQYERKRVQPGEMVLRTLDCPRGSLTGGGYRMSDIEDEDAFLVLANYPLADGRWQVRVRNISDRSQPLTLWIYALCDVK